MILPKLQKACVSNEIDLGPIIKDNGFYKGVWTLLYNYPLTTIFNIQKIEGDVFKKEVPNEEVNSRTLELEKEIKI